ncbi:MAG: ABC transporter permease [Planctomycetota bacterium]
MAAGPKESRWSLDPAEAKRLAREAREYRGESLWTDARRRLRRNRAARLSLWFLALFGLLSFLAPLLPIPSPKALSLRDDATAPEWMWAEPAPPPRPPAPGTAVTRSVRNLWNDGWRHRSTVEFAADDEAAAERARARVASLTGRSAALETRAAEDGGLEAYVSVPLARADVPGVAYEPQIDGSASVWEVAASDAQDAHAVLRLDLPGFAPERVRAATTQRIGRRLDVFLERRTPVDGLAAWRVQVPLAEKLGRGVESVAINGFFVPGSFLSPSEASRSNEQFTRVSLERGVQRPDLGRRIEASLTESPLDGASFVGASHEDGYWEFEGMLGWLDDRMLDIRARAFGLWQTGNWLGTDGKGRDLLARIVWGSRTSIVVGLIASLVSLVVGVLYGAFSGLMGGRIDNLMMRIVDVLYSIPFIFVVIFLITVVNGIAEDRPDLDISRELIFFFVIGAVYWLTMARVVRGQVLALKNTEFIEAARVVGASTARILLAHIVPNVLSIVIVYLTLTIPAVMLFEAFLSFLGLGIEPPKVSWGLLAVDGTQAINPIRIYWWLVVFPALAMGSTLLALNVLGDGLRDALDPKCRGR